MPNSNLFPNRYIKPCTTSAGPDPVAELQRQLITLRYQFVQDQRKQGQSVAELQNATVEIGFNEFDRPGLGRAYIGGGHSWKGRHVGVDKFRFHSETINPIAAKLPSPIIRHAGVASFTRGYWCGGYTGARGSRLNQQVIFRIDFHTEVTALQGQTLQQPTSYARGAQSDTAGYIGGRHKQSSPEIPESGEIQKLDFGAESTSVLAQTLPRVQSGSNAAWSQEKAYFAGGWTRTREIDSMTFATESTASVSAELSSGRLRGGNFHSPIKGYFSGGVKAPGEPGPLFLRSVDALDFASESTYVVARAQLSNHSVDCEGAGSSYKGYHFSHHYKGAAEGSDIHAVDGLNFTTERMWQISARLTFGGAYCAPVYRP